MTTTRQRLIAGGQLAVFLALAAVMIQALTPGDAVTGGALTKLLFVGRLVLMVALASWFLRMRGLTWADVGLRRPSWGRLALAIPLGLIATYAAAVAAKLLVSRHGASGADYSMFNPIRGNVGLLLFFVFPVAWGSAAFGEELSFRGFVLRTLEDLIGSQRWFITVAAIVIQAVLFGALHLYQGVGGAVTAGTIGLVLGLVWLASGRNLWAGIVIHGIVDTQAMVAIFLVGAPPH